MALLIPIVVFLAFLIICALMTVGEPLNPTRPLMSYDQAREYARQLQKMIACATVSREGSFDDTEFAKLRETMEELFPLVHKKCQKLTFGDDCWVYFLPGRDETHHIMLMSHHDVVEADGQWQYPPFSGTIADGKLWGRGTVDTKTSLFAIFSALEELLAEGFCPSCNVWIASSHNEEVAGDGIPLAAEFFREQGITFDFVLDEGGAVIDPPVSGMNCSKCAMLAIHEKGRHKLVLTAVEGSGHAGLTAGMKSTPTERMADFISEFRRENIFIRRMTPELERMLKAMAPYMTFPVRVVFSNLWFFKPLIVKILPRISAQAGGLLGTTCAFNDLITEEGGKRCTARIMLRCMDGDDLQADLAQLRVLAAQYGIQVTDGGESEYHGPSDPSLPPYGQIHQCIRSVFPDVPVIPFILPAGTDARHLTDLCACVLRFAPLRLSAQQLSSAHAENENVDIGAIGIAVAFYRRVLETYTSGMPVEDMEEDELEEIPEDVPQVKMEEIPEQLQDDSDYYLDDTQEYPLDEDGGYDLEEALDYPMEEPEEIPEDFSDYMLDDMPEFDLEEISDWEEII